MDVITNKRKIFQLKLLMISTVVCVLGGGWNFALANSCDVGTPVDYQNSECIDVEYSFEQRPDKDYIDFTNWEAQNLCSDYGRVRLKLITNDGWFSRYHNFDNDSVKTGKINGGITSILCCKGGSNSIGALVSTNICNMSDAVNSTTCLQQWKKSHASSSCWSPSFSITHDYKCTVTATCPKNVGHAQRSATAALRGMKFLAHCTTGITSIWEARTLANLGFNCPGLGNYSHY